MKTPDFPVNFRKSHQVSKNYLKRSNSYGQKPLGVTKNPPGLNRVKAVIHNLIPVDQNAYVKGRYIGESIRVINDLIEHIDREDEEGILFSTDIEKAFDSVEHNFLFATLKRYGFGTEFVNFIKTLLFYAKSCVINNGYTTNYFKL